MGIWDVFKTPAEDMAEVEKTMKEIKEYLSNHLKERPRNKTMEENCKKENCQHEVAKDDNLVDRLRRVISNKKREIAELHDQIEQERSEYDDIIDGLLQENHEMYKKYVQEKYGFTINEEQQDD